MSLERPDFSVDSQGNVQAERATKLLAELDLPKLFNAAGRKGSRDSEAFIHELGDLLQESGLTNESYMGMLVFRNVAEPLLKQEQVTWETFTKAVQSSRSSRHG